MGSISRSTSGVQYICDSGGDPTELVTGVQNVSRNKTIYDEYITISQELDKEMFLLDNLSKNSGPASLHVVAFFGDDIGFKVLIDSIREYYKTDPFKQKNGLEIFLRQHDDMHNTALHLAVENGYLNMVELLVTMDRSDRHIQNRKGETPIYLAAKLGHNEIVQKICEVCTNPTFDGPGGLTALHAAIRKRPHGGKLHNDVVEVIIDAATRSFSDDQFLDFIQKVDNYGDSVLHLAVQGNHLDVVKLIIEAKAAHPTLVNNDSKSPIYIAAEQGNVDILTLLYQCCKSLKTRGPGGQTVLHAAVIAGDQDCIAFILKEDRALGTWSDLNDMTPLCFAAQQGHISTLKKLIESLPENACLAVNLDRRNILHLAACQSDKEMIKCILESCPEEYMDGILNQRDIRGDTPLHLLVREGCFVPELIKHKDVDKLAKNKELYTAIDMLYLEDHIVADQLQIKKVLVDTPGSRQSRIGVVPPNKQFRKDAAFKIAEEKSKNKGIELYRERTSTQIIVTALITTVAFTVGFTMPGGYYQSGDLNEGPTVLSKKRAFRVFMVADAVALVLSTASLFLYFISSMYRNTQKVARLNAASSVLNIFSVIAMMITFMAGTYAVLFHSQTLAITVLGICCIFFVIVIGLLIQLIYDRRMMIYGLHMAEEL